MLPVAEQQKGQRGQSETVAADRLTRADKCLWRSKQRETRLVDYLYLTWDSEWEATQGRIYWERAEPVMLVVGIHVQSPHKANESTLIAMQRSKTRVRSS